MPTFDPRACFEAAVADLLAAIHHEVGTPASPVQTSAYVAAAFRTGEIGFQTLLGGFLRLRLENEGAQYRLAINCTTGKGLKQPDFQVLREGKPSTPVFMAECKLMDAGCKYNSAPSNVLRGFRDDLASLAEYKELECEHRIGCLFLVTGGSGGMGGFATEVTDDLAELKPTWIGESTALWLPNGVDVEPVRVRVAICEPMLSGTEPVVCG